MKKKWPKQIYMQPKLSLKSIYPTVFSVKHIKSISIVLHDLKAAWNYSKRGDRKLNNKNLIKYFRITNCRPAERPGYHPPISLPLGKQLNYSQLRRVSKPRELATEVRCLSSCSLFSPLSSGPCWLTLGSYMSKK